MEMNTRLQVEHPVTEAITGVDLVEWQLRVAAGGALPMSQDALSINGHSFEARIYAEDVPAGFLPAIGRLDHLEFSQDARIDTGVRQGDEITPFYDPMIAKLTVHAATREAALSQLDRALSRTQIAGTTTNIAFLRALSRHDDFAAGDVDTGLIERGLEGLSQVAVPCSRCRALAAVGALEKLDNPLAGFALWGALPQEVSLRWGEETIAARVSTLSDLAHDVLVAGKLHRVERNGSDWTVDGQKISATVVRHGAEITVFWGNTYNFQTVDPLDRASDAMMGGDVTLAPMPGLVKAVFVTAGETVAEGDKLAVLEAMKMEHVLRAPRAGVVAEVYVAQDTQVAAGVSMIALEPEA
jgi:3-methylcrotonyl-CoA carboxylase alpha subunit